MLLFVAATFLAASTDDLIWLPCLLAAFQRRAWVAAIGYTVGTLLLDLGCWTAARYLREQSWFVDESAVIADLVGVGFVLYGIAALWSWHRRASGQSGNVVTAPEFTPRSAPFVAGVLAVLANGWNNLILLPVIFVTPPGDQVAAVFGLAACNAIWAAVALGSVHAMKRHFETILSRYSQAVAGIGFLAVGIKICVA